MADDRSFCWKSVGETNVGKIRKLNEDAFIDRNDIGLWVVADGMGGHAAGDVASTMIVDAMHELDPPTSLSGFIDAIEDKLLSVNKKLIALAKEKHDSQTIGSTVVGMVGYGKYCVFFWVGDSRIYRLRENSFLQLSQDHTFVEELITRGLLNRDDAYNHPERNTITRAVGATEDLYIDLDYCEVEDGDIYLLCTDGLTKEVIDNEVKNALMQGDVNKSISDLINLTLARGARDNVTIVAIQAEILSGATG